MKRKTSKPNQLEAARTFATEYLEAVEKLVTAGTKLAEIVQNVEKIRLRRDGALLSALTKWDSLTSSQQDSLAQLVRSVGDKTARDILQSVSAQSIDTKADGLGDLMFDAGDSAETKK